MAAPATPALRSDAAAEGGRSPEQPGRRPTPPRVALLRHAPPPQGEQDAAPPTRWRQMPTMPPVRHSGQRAAIEISPYARMKAATHATPSSMPTQADTPKSMPLSWTSTNSVGPVNQGRPIKMPPTVGPHQRAATDTAATRKGVMAILRRKSIYVRAPRDHSPPPCGEGRGCGYENARPEAGTQARVPFVKCRRPSHPTPNPSPSRGGEQVGRNLTARCRRSAGCACRLPPARPCPSHTRCGRTGSWRRPRRARRPRPPRRAAPARRPRPC